MLSFFEFPDNFSKKFFVPLLAIVPRLLTRSSLFIPIPLSDIVIVFCLSVFSKDIDILGSRLIFLYFLSVKLRYLSLSNASEEFEISSRKNISLLEYKECIINCNNCETSVLNFCLAMFTFIYIVIKIACKFIHL